MVVCHVGVVLFEQHFPGSIPIVTGADMITVWPGETVVVKAGIEGERLVNLRAIPDAGDAAGWP
jgi:hypothetical protein